MNLLSTASSNDPVPFLTLSVAELERAIGVKENHLIELFNLMEEYQSFADAYKNVVEFISERIPGEILIKIKRAKELLVTAENSTSRTFYQNSDQNIFALSEILTDFSDSLEQLSSFGAFFGVEIAQDGAPVAGSISYQVRQGDTLETIALKNLGDSENWVQIARFNDIDVGIVGSSSPLDIWVGRKIQLPLGRNSGQLRRDPSVLDAPIGTRGLGKNYPLVLHTRTREDGTRDLDVLNYTNTLLEGLSTRLETPIGVLPDFPEYGSFLPNLLGQNFGNVMDRMLTTHVDITLRADPRVENVLEVITDRNDDKLNIYFQLNLFNGLTLEELWLSYTVTGV